MKKRQLTPRAIFAGMFLGGFLSLSNLYVVLKTGWSFGVSITAGILAFAFFSFLARIKFIKSHFGILENNAMQSVASAAGLMTGGGTAAAIPAIMMMTGQAMDPWQMFFWISSIAFLGVIVAIPMKQQMINIEQLRFPSGIAAAETLKALHGDGSGATQSNKKSKFLSWGSLFGAFIAFIRDAKANWIPWNLPGKLDLFPFFKLGGRSLLDYTVGFECSVVLIAAGAIMGFRAAWSTLLGGIINYVLIAPKLLEHGIISDKLGYKSIIAWSVWFGSSILLSSGLFSFAYQWRSVVRALRGLGSAFEAKVDGITEVPMSWFFWGVVIVAPVVVFLEWFLFGIQVWLGVISIFLSFFIAIVACRVTGETDTTPTGPLGKITQLTFGALQPGNLTVNIMTANVSAGVASHSSDLLVDLKSGYLLGADPKQQFWAQFFGVIAGSLFVVPAYHILIPTADKIGTDQWPVPAAQSWKAVAELLSKGVESLHPSARVAILLGVVLGILLVLAEKTFPKYKKFIPSPTGLGLGFTVPCLNSISMFIGASISLYLEKRKPKLAVELIIPMSSGLIAGESLMGILIAILVVLGVFNS